MTTLCIDTATEHGTVALARDDGSLASISWHSAGRHGENLFGHIDTALAEAGASREDLSLIGVDTGPGQFTSLRVGLSTAKGLAFALNLPIVGVSSLRVLGRSIAGGVDVVRVPILNAYRGDVFAAAYSIAEGRLEELVAPLFGPPELVLGQIRGIVGDRALSVGGAGVRSHAQLIESTFRLKLDEGVMSLEAPAPDGLLAEVREVFRQSGPADLDSLVPEYLRPSDAKLPARALRKERLP